MIFWLVFSLSLLASAGSGYWALRGRRRLPQSALPVRSARFGLQARVALVLAAVAAAAMLVAMLKTTHDVARNVDLGAGASMIVIDLSGSIDNVEMTMIGETLHALAQNPDRRVGLIFFSDSAVEVLPPQTPASELEKISRFFVPHPVRLPAQPPNPDSAATPPSSIGSYIGAPQTILDAAPPNPWQRAFDGGTFIARGLAAARQALEQVHAAQHGQIIVISDLQDDASWPQRVELMKDVRAGIDVKVVFVGYDPDYKKLWQNFYGPSMFLSDPQVLAVRQGDHLTNIHASLLVPALISLLIVLAAAMEIGRGRLKLAGER